MQLIYIGFYELKSNLNVRQKVMKGALVGLVNNPCHDIQLMSVLCHYHQIKFKF